MYLNSSSLTAHFDEIYQLTLRKSPLVIALSETCLTENILDKEINIQGYRLERVNSDSRKTGGATLYIREDAKILTTNQICKQKNYWLVYAYIIYKKKKYLLVSLYRSPNSSKRDFEQFFQAWCEENIIDENCIVLIVGDFNIDYRTDESGSFKEILIDVGLKNIVFNTTRSGRDKDSIIDLVLTNCNHLFKANVMTTPRVTDHFVIEVISNVKHKVSKSINTRGRNIDFLRIDNLLRNCDFRYFHADINEKFCSFVSLIKGALDLVAPIKTVKILPKYKEWWNANVEAATGERDFSYKIYRTNKTETNLNNYKRNRNTAVQVIREEKRRYYEEKIMQSKNNATEIWKILETILPTKKVKFKIDDVEIDNEIVSDINQLPDKLNNYFVNSIKDVLQDIDKSDLVDFPFSENNSSRFSDFSMLDIKALKDTIFGMANKASPDDINVNLLKNTFESIKYPLLNIVNSSLEVGQVPDLLKVSTIIPIPKISKSKSAGDFRPINLLCTIDKILEKVVYVQLVEYVAQNNILSDFQSGFRAKFSCETAIQGVLEDWRQNIDINMVIGAIFLDLRRAFETINRKRLILKLKSIGITGNALKWLVSYLTGRKQRLRVNNILSEDIPNELGVPQGSVLGPLLFNIYINDLIKNVNNCAIYLFADDALFYIATKDLHHLKPVMNEVAKNVYQWCNANDLKVNVSKTKCMVIAKESIYRQISSLDFKVMLGNDEIEMVTKFKYLGILIDRKLNFKSHAAELIKKISFKVSYLSRCSSYLSTWTKKTIYNVLILSHFHYCSSVLFLFKQNELCRLQKLQNRSMRIILAKPRLTPIKDMLKELHWLPVRELLLFNTLTFIHKIKIGHAPQYLSNKIVYTSDIHQYNTRHRENFYIPRVLQGRSQNSLYFKGLNRYNELPAEVKCKETVASFKMALKRCLFSELDM